MDTLLKDAVRKTKRSSERWSRATIFWQALRDAAFRADCCGVTWCSLRSHSSDAAQASKSTYTRKRPNFKWPYAVRTVIRSLCGKPENILRSRSIKHFYESLLRKSKSTGRNPECLHHHVNRGDICSQRCADLPVLPGTYPISTHSSFQATEV